MKSAMTQCLVKHGWVEKQLVKPCRYVQIDGVTTTPAVVHLPMSPLCVSGGCTPVNAN